MSCSTLIYIFFLGWNYTARVFFSNFLRFYYFKPVPFQRVLKGSFFVDTEQSVRVLSVLVWFCFGKKMMFREFFGSLFCTVVCSVSN